MSLELALESDLLLPYYWRPLTSHLGQTQTPSFIQGQIYKDFLQESIDRDRDTQANRNTFIHKHRDRLHSRKYFALSCKYSRRNLNLKYAAMDIVIGLLRQKYSVLHF